VSDTPLFPRTATLSHEERNARIVAAWNRGDVTQAALGTKWNLSQHTICTILRNARWRGATVLPVDLSAIQRRSAALKNPVKASPPPSPEPERHLIARSLCELTATYRIVGELQIVAGRTKEESRWFYTLSDADRHMMEFDRSHGLVTTAQKRIEGKLYLVAKLAPVRVGA
jgi:hypothetical protein